MKIRTFIALEIPKPALEEIISARRRIYDEDQFVKWEPNEKLHITLKFLGDTDEAILPELKESLAVTVSAFNQLNLKFERFGIFYRDKMPSILWLGLKKNEKLKELFLEIEKNFEKFGFQKEKREFKPHLTLLRIKGKEDFSKLEKFKEEPDINLEFKGNKIIFFKSTLLRSGSVYEEIESFLLK